MNARIMPMEEKIEKSKAVIAEAIERYGDKLVVAFTGGKDSTLMLWLVKQVCEEEGYAMPECMFINEGSVFEEVLDYVERMRREWDLVIHEVKNEDVLRQVTKVGDIVHVAKLNERNRKELEKIGFRGESFVFNPESFEGNHLMKTVAMNMFIEERSIKAVMTGIRWDEQEARSDEVYFSPRSDPTHMRVHPILHFTEREVWQVLRENRVPVNELYAKGYRSLGAKATTQRVSDLPAWEQDLDAVPERAGRAQDKEGIMKRLRDLGYM
ncbi:phosphoadenosine phosphosulfate reductase family protein [Candidatus Pyrohabitans sp.]